VVEFHHKHNPLIWNLLTILLLVVEKWWNSSLNSYEITW